jgi:acylphosphatase
LAEDIVRARARVRGRVQGVWFRQSTAERALSLGLSGWVRNLDDGGVEAEFEGPRASVEAAIDFVRTGPPRAEVVECDVSWEEVQGASGFEITG